MRRAACFASSARPCGRWTTARVSAVALVCVGAALVLSPVAGSAAGQALSFAATRSFATGEGPDSLGAGDLDGDGRPDLATANYSSGTVSVLRNRGDGRFEGKRDYTAGMHPYLVTPAPFDLNGDGKPDLLVDSGAGISVFLNRGDGSFDPKRDYAVGESIEAVTDLNGDDRPDLVAVNSDANTLSVLLNQGDGSFGSRSVYKAGRDPESVWVADLNHDGARDLVTESSPRAVSVFLNRGNGSLEPRHDYATARYPTVLGIADLSGDDRPDVVTGNVGSISVLLNSGAGGFRAHRDYRTCAPCFPGIQEPPEVAAIAIADLNRDRKPDLATRNLDVLPHELSGGTVSVFVNKGEGTFRAQHTYRTGRPAEELSGWLALVDLNGNGTPELVTEDRGERPHLLVQVGRGDGSFGSRLEYRIGDPGPTVVADLNGDRRPDLAVANELGATVSVLLNRPGLCNVQYVKGMKLGAATRTLALAGCRVGKVRRAYSRVKLGRVISQSPRFGVVLTRRGKVNLVVSRGRRR
jgi:FG-GAP-like repeat/PASTA domain